MLLTTSGFGAETATTEGLITFDIRAQHAHLALIEFAKQADQTLVFSFELTSDLQTNALVGKYLIGEGLDVLLKGTGLSAAMGIDGQLTVVRNSVARGDIEMRDKTKKRSLFGRLVTGLLLGSAGAGASAAESDVDSSQPATQIEEIVVTARRQSENLQEVPLSITAFTGEQFQDAGLIEFSDISQITPNFQIAPSGATGSTFANLTIRAQTAGFLTINADQAVGIYIDGAPVTRGTGLFSNLFDIDRVEVLRGPQGTLYGMNTTGGAVSIVTKSPVFNELSGYVEGTAGNFDRRDVEGVVNIPLIEDKLAARIGVSFTNRDGFGEGEATGADLADDKESTVRATVLYEPSDTVSIRFKGDYHEADEAGSIFRSLQTVLGGFLAQESLDPDIFVGNELGTVEQFAESREWDLNLTARVDIGDLTLESITSYREQDSSLAYQQVAITDVALAQDSDIFAQEVRLSGDAFEEKLDWQVGVFYSDESGVDDDFLPGLGQFEVTAAENKSWSIFTQSSYALSDRLSATLGLRYTDVDRRVEDLEPGAPIFSAQEDFDAVSWLVSLDYKLTDDWLAYASVSRGFRSGSIDQGDLAVVVDPEFVVNYEVGFKADALDNRLRLNVSGYYSDYEDIQRTSFDPAAVVPVTILRNAAEATIFGFEVDATAAIVEGLTFSTTIGYTNAEYDEFLDLDGFGNVLDRTDEPFGGPEWQLSFSGRYERSLSSDALLGVQLNYFWQDEDDRATDALLESLTPAQARIDSYGILNGQIDLDIASYGVRVAVFGTNLADEEYFTAAFVVPIGALGTVSNRITGNPRTWGLRVSKSF